MRFYETAPAHDLTYSDVFLVPTRSAVGSRLDVSLTPAGDAFIRAAIVRAQQVSAATTERLTPAERKTLLALLDRI